MARKLKSDRVLFTATLLLVFASIVMVYSASALVAAERYQQPYLFLTKQVLWAALGGSTGALVATKTGQTTNGSGVMSISDASFASATQYRVVVVMGSGAEGMAKYTTS